MPFSEAREGEKEMWCGSLEWMAVLQALWGGGRVGAVGSRSLLVLIFFFFSFFSCFFFIGRATTKKKRCQRKGRLTESKYQKVDTTVSKRTTSSHRSLNGNTSEETRRTGR